MHRCPTFNQPAELNVNSTLTPQPLRSWQGRPKRQRCDKLSANKQRPWSISYQTSGYHLLHQRIQQLDHQHPSQMWSSSRPAVGETLLTTSRMLGISLLQQAILKKNYYRRKNLIPVNFTFDTSSNKLSSSVSSTPATSSSSDAKPKKSDEPLNAMCPSCKKELSNNTLMFRA